MDTSTWTFDDWFEYYYDLALSRGDGEDYAWQYADCQATFQTQY